MGQQDSLPFFYAYFNDALDKLAILFLMEF